MKRVLRIVVPVLILAVGAVGMKTLASMKDTASRDRPQQAAPAVEVAAVQPMVVPARIRATGVVRPAREVTLGPEVGGVIIWQSEELVPGGRFQSGQVIVRVDPRDYQMALDQENSRIERATLELETEQARQRVAQREWELLGKDPNSDEAALALRGPHVDAAREALRSAQSGLDRARLQLERTSLRAPFPAVVKEEFVEVGQVLQPGARVVSLIGTEQLWVMVSLPVEELGAVEFPASGRQGSLVEVTQQLGGGVTIVRQGRVERLASTLDPQTRTAQLVAVIERPFETKEGELPLLPGAFVDVVIEGKTLTQVYEVPRRALDDGERVWVVNQDNKLERKTLTVIWRSLDDVYVSEGLAPGERVVVTPLALPLVGMSVRVIEAPAPAAMAATSETKGNAP
ncbi:MAG: efflux RND transporter periplasmic adaptor subunit [Myxococcota bacterium]